MYVSIYMIIYRVKYSVQFFHKKITSTKIKMKSTVFSKEKCINSDHENILS